MAVTPRLNLLLVLFIGLVWIGNSVNAKPWESGFDSGKEIAPGISTNLNVGKAFDVLTGKREVNVHLGSNGIVVEAGLTDQEKIIYGACILGALVIIPILCCLCCRACCSSPRPPTTIIYQRMPESAANGYTISQIPLASTHSGVPPPYQKSSAGIHM